MVSLDVVRAKNVEASMEESRRKLKGLCDTVSEIIAQMNEENGLQNIRVTLDKQLESLEQDLSVLSQSAQCLRDIIPVYMGCEEKVAVFAEEMQMTNMEVMNEITEVEIPEWIFQMLG